MPIRFPRALTHPLCLLGMACALVGFAASTVALVADISSGETRAYQGILTFLLFPSVLVVGVFLVGLGLFLERRRVRRLTRSHEDWRPALDPRRSSQRSVILALGCGVFVLIVLSIFGSVRAYEFTESTQFCGALCHTAMEPQFLAHANSPHARIHCV